MDWDICTYMLGDCPSRQRKKVNLLHLKSNVLSELPACCCGLRQGAFSLPNLFSIISVNQSSIRNLTLPLLRFLGSD